MSGNKLKESWVLLLKAYNQLPYIALKKYSKFYLIPHRPSKPGPLNFQIARQKIREESEKYNQYFLTENIWDKVSQKYEEGISDPKLNQSPKAHKFEALMKEYFEKSKQYNFKYKEPLQLMNKNAYFIFKRQEYRRLKEASDKSTKEEIQSREAIQQPSYETVLKDETAKKKANLKNSLANLEKMRKMNLSEKWKNLTDEEKQVYVDLETKMKRQNERRIQQFIENHQIPVVKRYSVISRFTTRYAPVHGLKLRDKKLYEIYYALPETEKQTFKEEAHQMNQESKQRYMEFLKKWDLSHEKLKNIIQISEKHRKGKIEKIKATKKKNFEDKKNRYWSDDEDDFDDIEIQNQDQL